MPKKRYTPEAMIQHLRTVELDTGKGLAVLDSCQSSASPSTPTSAGRRNTAGCAWIKPRG